MNTSKKKKYKFIDLFAGIGGTRLGFESVGAECVFTSEWDKYSKITYEANFGDIPYGDIRDIKSKDIPDFDILLAGFPCQPFSLAGVSKKLSLGRTHGFEDEKQGNLFFEITRILEGKNPPAFMLENVKNLMGHDKGNTFKRILYELNELDYKVFYKILDAKYYVPQHRERTFIIGFKKGLIPDNFEFEFPKPRSNTKILKNILEQYVPDKYTLSDKLWNYLQKYAIKHREKGNGFGFGIANPEGITRTLSARYHKDGSEILIEQEGRNPRRLTPRECARLMGFPEKYKIVVSDTQTYKQFGNSIVVPLVKEVAKRIIEVLEQYYGQNKQTAEKLEYVTDKREGHEARNYSPQISLFKRS